MSDEGITTTTTSPDPVTTFTAEQLQTRLNEVGAKEKAEGERAGARRAQEEFLKALGVDNVEDAQALIKAQREAEDKTKSENEKLKEEFEKFRAASTQANSDAVNSLTTERIKNALLVAKVPLTEGKEAESLATLAGFVKVEAGASSDDIAAAIDKLKETVPALFAAVNPSATPGSTPSSVAPMGGQAGLTSSELAAKAAEAVTARLGVPVNQ